MSETTVLPPDTEVPSQRADLPAIWGEYKKQVEELKATAETLVVTDISQTAQMQLARTTRLALKKIRCAVETKREELGEDALRTKQKIDRDAKEIKDAIAALEKRLQDQEDFAERKEAERKAELAHARGEQIRPLGADPAAYLLADMPDEGFATLLAGLKAAKTAREEELRVAAEAKAAKAKAEAEERERIRVENERLKAEAAQKEAELQAERERVAKERAAEEAKARAAAAAAAEAARKEREAIEAKAKAEREAAEAKAAEERRKAAEELAAAQRERDRIEAEKAKELAVERAKAEAARKAAAEKARIQHEEAIAAAREERAAREKVEAELRAKQEAEEAKRKADALAAKKAAAAPDKQKIAAFASAVRGLAAPECSTLEGQAITTQIADQVAKFAAWVEKQAATL